MGDADFFVPRYSRVFTWIAKSCEEKSFWHKCCEIPMHRHGEIVQRCDDDVDSLSTGKGDPHEAISSALASDVRAALRPDSACARRGRSCSADKECERGCEDHPRTQHL